MLKESTSAMPDELRDRSTRATHRAQGYQSDLSNINTVIDGSTSWSVGDVGVSAHFNQRLADELAQIPDTDIPDKELVAPRGSFGSPFTCFMTYPRQGKDKTLDETAQFGDQAFPSVAWTTILTRDFLDQFGTDLVPYLNTMKNVGGSSAYLRKGLKQRLGEKVLDAFNDYLQEVFDRVKSPFVLTQGEV